VLARQLAVLLIVELDQVDSAKEAAATSGDAALERMISLALKTADNISATESLELADWYRSLSDHNASPTGRENALKKARDAYQLFLDKHESNDAERLQAKLALEQAEAELRKFEQRAAVLPKAYNGKKVLLIFSGKELEIATTACRQWNLTFEVADRFDAYKEDYSDFHTIICGSEKMDYWGEGERQAPKAFSHINTFIEAGGHLAVFGTWNGRHMDHLKRYGITTGFNHCNYFAPVTASTEKLFLGNEHLIPKDRLMRSVGNFACSAKHTVLLRRGSSPTEAEKDPAMITLLHKKGRITFNLVEPSYECEVPGAAKENYWLIDVTVSWIARACPE